MSKPKLGIVIGSIRPNRFGGHAAQWIEEGDLQCSFSPSRLAALGTLVIAGALSLPVRAEELVQNLGPVGPHDPILTTVGSKRVIAFYTPDGRNCGIYLTVWDPKDADASSTIRVRVSLNPQQRVHVDSAEHKSLGLQCGDDAARLTIVDSGEQLGVGLTQ